jgi:hypothetical protein
MQGSIAAARQLMSAPAFFAGPFLKINWDMVEAGWESQWTGDEGSYIGSANDGAGDPVVGYANYDYDSIMHYATQGEAETIPPGQEHRLGAGTRASRLSPGDIAQAKDSCVACFIRDHREWSGLQQYDAMARGCSRYQCRSRASAAGARGVQVSWGVGIRHH